MTPPWTQAARESAYTRLCEAVTAAGRERETVFLARLSLLLAEELNDPEAFGRALSSAAFDDAPGRDPTSGAASRPGGAA